MLRHVEVCGVAVHLTLFVPTWIQHRTHRSIVVRLLRTTTQTHRVILHDSIREQVLKPVGVAKFCLAQIGVARLLCVGECKLTCARIERIDQFIHVTIHSVVATIEHFGEIEPTAVVQFAIDAHLVLRIEDVEIAVRGNQACGKFARVVDMRLSLLTLLGGHHNHTRHGARTIDGGCATVFQDLETLNVVCVQSCNGRTDQRFGITRSQVVSIHIRHIFHDYTIHYPKWFGSTEDGRGTAHTDFRSRTKCATHVLHRHTGCASFERATHVCHTAQSCSCCIHFVGSTSKHAAVGFRQTCHHHFAQRLRIFQCDFHVGVAFQGLRLHAEITHGNVVVLALDG